MYLVGKYVNQDMYAEYYESFNKYFLKDDNVTYLVVTDDPSKLKNFSNKPNVVIRKCEPFNDINYAKRCKFHLMFENERFLKNFQYIHIANCNLRCSDFVTKQELLGNHSVAIAIHPCYDGRNFMTIYGRNENTTVDISKMDKSKFLPYQACNIFASKLFMFKLMAFVESNRIIDACSDRYTAWHDETYVVYYLNAVAHPNVINALDPKLYAVPDIKRGVVPEKPVKMYLVDKKNYLTL